MTEREIAERELAEYGRWAAEHPDAPGIDASDLAAIGAARHQPDITRAQVAELVRVALAHGRTWAEIADRLGMTPMQAERAYGTPAKTQQLVISAALEMVANALRAAQKALNVAEGLAREHSRH